MHRVLVVGAHGLLGSSLVPQLRAAGHEVISQSRGPHADLTLDPGDTEALGIAVDNLAIDTVVNLAGATNVDFCEDHPQAAYLANVRTVLSIAQVLQERRVRRPPHLVHISTDQVYDGKGPHYESSPCPCNVYALSKLAGELAAQAIDATILRTNFVGRSRCPGREGFSDWLIKHLRSRAPITVFDDVLFSPLNMGTLCQFIDLMVMRRVSGLFNLGSGGGTSKAEFAMRLAHAAGLDSSCMKVGRSQDARLRAKRPLDMRLNTSHFERAFGVIVPQLELEIQLTAREYGIDESTS